jgi:hypothetical protein
MGVPPGERGRAAQLAAAGVVCASAAAVKLVSVVEWVYHLVPPALERAARTIDGVYC